MEGRGACNQHFIPSPLKIIRAQKQYMTDNIGVQYLDCVSNVAHVGHCHPQVVLAGKNQMATLVTAQGFVNDLLSKYVKELTSHLPDSLNVVYLVNSGSEANDLALRLARTYTNSKDVVVFDEAYHGNLGNLIDISPKMFKRMPQGKKDFVHIIPCPDTYRGLFRENTSGPAAEKYVMEAERILNQATQNNRKISCLITECVVVNCGVIVPPRNYFALLYNLIREMGGVCIADEVQTALGRTGECFWAFEHYGVVPDIVTTGKPLGNGHPMAAVITTREISDALGEYYSTFGGNPVACAIGMAVLDVIENEKLVQSAKAVGKTLLENLQLLKAKHACVGDVRGLGLCLALDIVEDKATRKPARELAQTIVYRVKEEHHILLQVQGPGQNIITITPPMCFTQLNARSLTTALDQVLSTCSLRDRSATMCHTLGLEAGRRVLSLEELEQLDDEVPGPEPKRPRTSYDDID
ncbi:ethanolamine-phosphate phospho-lyase-like isoform X1 [Eriocheir sinensis]|uniref:ethanolamine-phosphate phospho-lyase-like isoform X1 n=2 Tax=Eriocheir sinensis TaxID=95602 RepID=UPI0021CABAB3|nr:ethanolamine-phosphate phospho-lyase-like isoform X1 [Eriocheir sinensis]